jgi:hypothetical protein
MKARQIWLDMAMHMAIIVLPQPIFYIVVEFIKCFGELGKSLYYPNSWSLLAQITLIIVLYIPFYL